MVDFCLGLKGASNLYSVLGNSEKNQKTKTVSLGDCDKGQVEKEGMTAAIQYTGSFRLPATGGFVKGTSERHENVKSGNYACKRFGDIKMFADVFYVALHTLCTPATPAEFCIRVTRCTVTCTEVEQNLQHDRRQRLPLPGRRRRQLQQGLRLRRWLRVRLHGSQCLHPGTR